MEFLEKIFEKYDVEPLTAKKKKVTELHNFLTRLDPACETVTNVWCQSFSLFQITSFNENRSPFSWKPVKESDLFSDCNKMVVRPRALAGRSTH